MDTAGKFLAVYKWYIRDPGFVRSDALDARLIYASKIGLVDISGTQTCSGTMKEIERFG